MKHRYASTMPQAIRHRRRLTDIADERSRRGNHSSRFVARRVAMRNKLKVYLVAMVSVAHHGSWDDRIGTQFPSCSSSSRISRCTISCPLRQYSCRHDAHSSLNHSLDLSQKAAGWAPVPLYLDARTGSVEVTVHTLSGPAGRLRISRIRWSRTKLS